jgi:glycosyltransferase involved in cell wall biosynthesis
MRVLALVTDAFGGHGGIALYQRNVLQALCEHPSRPHVVAIPRLVPRQPERMPTNLDFRVAAKAGKVRFVAETARAVAVGKRIDLVVAGHVNLLPLAVTACALTGAPLLLFVYGIDAWQPRARWTRHLIARADACVAIREHTLERMRTWSELPARSYVLHNGIHLERYGRGGKRRDLVERYGLDDKRVLLTLSRVDDPYFGIDEVLEVLEEVVREVPDLVYLVAGDGKDLQRVRDKARALGVEEHVVFAGYVDDADKADHYRLADAFAMPGSAAGMPGRADFDRCSLAPRAKSGMARCRARSLFRSDSRTVRPGRRRLSETTERRSTGGCTRTG